MARRYSLVLALSLALFSCQGSAAFNYRAYVLDAREYDGFLRGPAEKDDLPLEECRPTAKVKDQCYIVKKSTYYQLKADYLNMQEQLMCFQSGRCKPGG